MRLRPIVGRPPYLGDIAFALRNCADPAIAERLAAASASLELRSHAFPVSSGNAAFYAILTALKAGSSAAEVVMPAYTAGSLVVAVRKAGLKPVLADVSLRDFNGDAKLMAQAVNANTLAVLAVHMFGVGMDTVTDLKRSLPPGVRLIEDCCQSMGSSIAGRPVGSFGDVSFFSFGRGKNLSACGGGCIMTDDGQLARRIGDACSALPGPAPVRAAGELPWILAFSVAVNPWVYGIFNAMIAPFRESSPPADFAVEKMSPFRAALVLGIMKGFASASLRRSDNGRLIAKYLKDTPGVRLPSYGPGDRPVFYRYPVIFDDRFSMREACDALMRSGIEPSRMYRRPLHHIFDLGYEKGAFPNACLMAERLLALPVDPSVREKDVARMARAIGRVAG